MMQWNSAPSLRSGALAHFVRSVCFVVDVVSLRPVNDVEFERTDAADRTKFWLTRGRTNRTDGHTPYRRGVRVRVPSIVLIIPWSALFCFIPARCPNFSWIKGRVFRIIRSTRANAVSEPPPSEAKGVPGQLLTWKFQNYRGHAKANLGHLP